MHRTLPSEIEPTALDQLIADAAALPTQVMTIQPTAIRLPPPRQQAVSISDATAHLVDSFSDYGG